MDIRVKVGRNVRRLRREMELSQESLGLTAGVDRAYVSAVERGKRNPTVVILEKLAKALGVPLGDLVAEPPPKRRRLGER